MARPIVDTTAGEQDWWEPNDLIDVLNRLMSLNQDKLDAVRRAVRMHERNYWTRHYEAARIRTLMERTMTYDEAVKLIERVTK